MSHPDPADLAELADVEAELDTRWPETKIEPSLSRISALMDLLGSPQRSYPSIHIAGTNGKTSVTRMIDALLTAMHRRTGRITSPHLQLATERISVDNAPITPRAYVGNAYRELEPYITMVDDSSTAAGGPRMSKFEVLTAMAFAVFAEAPVDVAIVRAGMGGRWDCGQRRLLAGRGHHSDRHGPRRLPGGHARRDRRGEGRDHQGCRPRCAGPARPGDRPGGPGPRSGRRPPARHRRGGHGGRAGRVGVHRPRCAHRRGRPAAGTPGSRRVYSEVFLPLHGAHQAANASLALAASPRRSSAPEPTVGSTSTRCAPDSASVTNPGRLERVRSAPTVYLDAAHSPHGAAALAQALTEEFDFQRLIGVVSVLGDKDVAGLLDALEPVLDKIVLTNNGSPRAWTPSGSPTWRCRSSGRIASSSSRSCPTRSPAGDCPGQGRRGGAPLSGAGVVITGSVVTAGAARLLFGKEPA